MLVFKVTDGVKTPEEVTPWEGGAHVSDDEVFSFIQYLEHSISLYSGISILAFIEYKTIDRLGYFSSANTSGLGTESELGQTHPSLYWV